MDVYSVIDFMIAFDDERLLSIVCPLYFFMRWFSARIYVSFVEYVLEPKGGSSMGTCTILNHNAKESFGVCESYCLRQMIDGKMWWSCNLNKSNALPSSSKGSLFGTRAKLRTVSKQHTTYIKTLKEPHRNIRWFLGWWWQCCEGCSGTWGVCLERVQNGQSTTLALKMWQWSTSPAASRNF